ncbi:MAG: TrkH family potassium uptake protein, partial [Alistipes sp.]|nr:TrkH family potassium uptake protein [Alistipes sp.]
MLFIASFMLLSAGISYVSGMDSAFYPLLLSGLLTALLGAFPLIFVEKKVQLSSKEGFGVVVGSWLVACVVGMF